MKNNKFKKIVTGIVIGANVFMLVACGSAKSADSNSDGYTTTQESTATTMDTTTSDMSMADSATATGTPDSAKLAGTQAVGDVANNVVSGQKLIKDVNLSVETKEFDAFIVEVNTQISGLGGYVQSSDVSGGSYQYENYRYGTIVARIPADKLNGFIQIVNEKGNVVHTSEMTTDITLQYVDMESHIKALKVEQETLIGLLEKAEKMEDVIAIQSQLTQVRYELDSYESQIRTYDNLVDYSTVTINITEVERETNTDQPSFINEIKAKLGNNLFAIKEGFRSFAINIIAALPYLVMWGIIITILIIAGRKIYKKIDKKEKKNTKKTEVATKTENTEQKDESKEE